jgi:2-polyprenyl-3-methyl-5-hydroxy-6-metoxy-1,4-benzoquinol methylase
MDPGYASAYADLYQRHWWWRAREPVIMDALHRYRPASGWRSALDVGCGDGLFFDRLREFAGRVEGIEADERLVSTSAHPKGRIYIAPFDASFRPGKTYSLIVMLDVLEHLRDPAAALRRARELLDPDGTLLLTVPAFRSLWTHHDDLNRHLTRYTREELAPLLQAAGFEVLEGRYFFHWTVPAKLAVRFAEQTFRLDPRPAKVPPSWLNGLLYGISRLEERALGWLKWRVGSSLLVVARKE